MSVRKMRPRLTDSNRPALSGAERRLKIARNAGTILAYALMTCAALALPTTLGAQSIRITGSIPCAGRVEISGTSTSLSGESSGRSVRVPIPNDQGGLRPVVLSLRTNCSYGLTAEWIGPAGTSVKVLPGAISPAGGTGRLRADALKSTFTPAELAPGMSAVCVRGAAVSRGGNNTSSDNAVLIEVLLDLPREVPDSAVLFTLNLGS